MSDTNSLDPAALERLREWGGDKLLGQMVRLFITNAPERMRQIREGESSGDVGEAEKGAHSLKSSAANVGAERVRALAAEMESVAVDGDAAAVSRLLPSLEGAFSEAIAELETIVEGIAE